MSNVIIILILAVILGAAAGYVIKAKKKGSKCIGCPEGCCPAAAKTENGTVCSYSCVGCGSSMDASRENE